MHLWIPARLVADLADQPLSRWMVLTWGISNKEPTDLETGPAIPGNEKWKFSGSPVNQGLAVGLDEAVPKRGRANVQKTDPSLGKPKTITSSYGYEDAMRHGYLTEMEKQWLYWREAVRREAERAKPWNTHKG